MDTPFSYINDADGPFAEELENSINNIKDFQAVRSPSIPEISIENSEKIANDIDSCSYFISVYTKTAKRTGSRWLDQELGYAYSNYRKGRIKIIIITDDRGILKGFFNKKFDNITFQIKKGGEKVDIGELTQKISRIVKMGYEFPFDVKIVPNRLQNIAPEQAQDNFLFNICINNKTSLTVKDITIDVIYNTPDITLVEGNEAVIDDRESEIIPEYYSIHSEYSPIRRRSVVFEKIIALDSYDTYWMINGFNKKWMKKFTFAVFIKAPIYGIKGYFCEVWREGNDLKLISFDDDREYFHIYNRNVDRVHQ